MSLLGCDGLPNQPLVSEFVSSNIALYLIASAIALVFVMMAAYYARRRKQDLQDLKKSLIAEQDSGKFDMGDDSPSCMYIDGDISWKPPSQDDSPQAIQPLVTTSISSPTRFFKDRVLPYSEESMHGGDSNVNSDNESSTSFDFAGHATPRATRALVDIVGSGAGGTISPISSQDESLNGGEENDDLEGENSVPPDLNDQMEEEKVAGGNLETP
jgi:hypothetical protein